MTRTSDFSLRAITLSSGVWYCTVVGGWALIATAIAKVAVARDIHHAPALAMTAALLIILELLPLVQGRGHDPQGIVMSTAFVCAMLFLWGIWPAIVLVAIASLAADLRAGKAWWKTAFNPAQYSVSVAAGGVLLLFASHAASLMHPLEAFDMRDLCWVFGASAVYFFVNLGLVAGVLSWSGSFRAIVANDFRHYATMSFAVLALAPLIVVVAQQSWLLLPLLLIPLLLLYHTAAMSLEREDAASHDPLTGLLNRSALQLELLDTFAEYRRDGVEFGLMLIDIDNFKQVNDTLGHAIGDILLVQFADRLRDFTRADDVVARLGGDEFAVIVSDVSEDGVVAIAQRICTSISDSVQLNGLSIEIDVSIGIAMCPAHGEDPGALLRRADIAMYFAKSQHTRVEVYSSDCDGNTVDRLGLLGELRRALADDTIELYYQPKLSIVDGSPLGVEALVRWNHPTRGFIAPDEFVPLAERSGIMPLLTAHIVRLALAQTARWRDEGMPVPIAINVSPTDLVGDDLCAVVCASLLEHNLAPSVVKIEITERLDTRQLQDARRTLRRLRDMGVSISLDDFGTGYSSLLRLSSIEVDEIKIDRSFVSAMSSGDRSVSIVRTMIDLSRALGMTVVAEGVETAGELAQLTALGCDGVQGWLLAMPMSTTAATAWLHGRMDAALSPA